MGLKPSRIGRVQSEHTVTESLASDFLAVKVLKEEDTNVTGRIMLYLLYVPVTLYLFLRIPISFAQLPSNLPS